VISNPGPDMVKGSLTVQHHFDRGSDSETFNDPGGWDKASYSAHPIDSMEPLSGEPNPYREAALYHLQLMYAVDEFLTAAEDSRLAVVAVAVVFGWPSTRGLTLGNIADQLGCSLSTLSRSIARFKAMAGLELVGDGVRFIGNGAGSSNGDKPVATAAANALRRMPKPPSSASLEIAHLFTSPEKCLAAILPP
jgi:hypothetical protein